jgi:hypothetical protein
MPSELLEDGSLFAVVNDVNVPVLCDSKTFNGWATETGANPGYYPLPSLGSSNAALAKNRKTAAEPTHSQKARCQRGEWRNN